MRMILMTMALAGAGCGKTHDLGDAAAGADARAADAGVLADAPAHGRAFVYYSGYGGVGGLSLDTTTGALTALPGAWPASMSGDNLLAIAVDPTGTYLYGAAFSDGVVIAYSIDHATGALTHVGDVTVPGGASYVAVDPLGRAVYVSEYSGNALAVYTIDGATGVLTAAGSIPVVAAPRGIAIDPHGKTLAVAGGASPPGYAISMCTLDATTGAPTKHADVAAGDQTVDVAYDATGTRLYATATGTGMLALYDVDPATAAATLRTSVAAGQSPLGFALTPGGTTIYTASQGDGIEQIAIAADGTPSAAAGTPVAPNDIHALAVAPGGTLLIGGNNAADLFTYAIDATTGALTPLAQMPIGVFNGYVVVVVKA